MCVMITEILTIEGGQKRCLLTRVDQIYEKKIIIINVKKSQISGILLSGNAKENSE